MPVEAAASLTFLGKVIHKVNCLETRIEIGRSCQ